MVTALVLQLIQCIIKLPQKSEDEDEEEEDTTAQDVVVATSYEQAMKTAHHFLSVFLKKFVPHSLLLSTAIPVVYLTIIHMSLVFVLHSL